MDKKTQTSKIYIATSINNHENDQEEYKLDEETYNNQGQQWMGCFKTFPYS
jgi:hypothetical protein